MICNSFGIDDIQGFVLIPLQKSMISASPMIYASRMMCDCAPFRAYIPTIVPIENIERNSFQFPIILRLSFKEIKLVEEILEKTV